MIRMTNGSRGFAVGAALGIKQKCPADEGGASEALVLGGKPRLWGDAEVAKFIRAVHDKGYTAGVSHRAICVAAGKYS